MKRAEIIAKKPYGVIEYEGATYILLQDAYGDWVPGKYPYYQAIAIKEGEQVNEFDELPVYRIFWDVLDEYVDMDEHFGLKADAPEDESCLCNWDEASDVQAEGVMDADGWIH